MALSLKMLNTSAQWSVLKSGSRVFGLLGKATPFGLSSFTRNDITRSWALTAEYGCLRLERLTGDEEVTTDQLVLPTPFSYEYGVDGSGSSAEITRSIFGLLPTELEQLVSVLRRGSFPVLGFSQVDLRCNISGCTIPGYWPHVVVSNLAIYGNIVSIETFVRIMVASLPQGQIGQRFPALHQVIQQMMKLMATQRRGILYSREMLELVPPVPLAA
ncbi:MAG TPA: hypothetical protein VL793_16825 [Patescibacteria group bacterium]|nr:hypothetical protein [Patescibacteria group bacterium]